MQTAIIGLLAFIGLLLAWIMFEMLSAFDLSLWWGLAVIGLVLVMAFGKKIKTSMDLTTVVGVSILLGFLAGGGLYHPIVDAVVDSINNVHIQLPSSISIDAVELGGLVVVLIIFYKKIKALMEYIALPFFIICLAVVVMPLGMVAHRLLEWIIS